MSKEDNTITYLSEKYAIIKSGYEYLGAYSKRTLNDVLGLYFINYLTNCLKEMEDKDVFAEKINNINNKNSEVYSKKQIEDRIAEIVTSILADIGKFYKDQSINLEPIWEMLTLLKLAYGNDDTGNILTNKVEPNLDKLIEKITRFEFLYKLSLYSGRGFKSMDDALEELCISYAHLIRDTMEDREKNMRLKYIEPMCIVRSEYDIGDTDLQLDLIKMCHALNVAVLETETIFPKNKDLFNEKFNKLKKTILSFCVTWANYTLQDLYKFIF